MATLNDDIATINTRFFDIWPISVHVVQDNDTNEPEPSATWCRLSIQPGARLRQTLGERRYLQLGRVYLQIFVPAQMGWDQGWALADTFNEIFNEYRSPDYRINFGAPEFRVSDAEKEYFTVICSAPYTSEH